jgi:hypothetical protein
MKNFRAMTAGCFFVLAFAATVLAQGGPLGGAMGPLPRGMFNPVVGSGAQYEIQPTGKDKMTVEIDVVGKEPVNGKDGYWFETAFDSHMGQMTMKMLMVSDAANATIAKLIMQMHGAPPMEMPAQMIGQRGQQTYDIREKADKVGSESVTTPAGTFTADHYHMKDGSGDFWVSDKVSPYGLIKGQGKDFNMVLIKVVTDAKDKITGTVVPFNPALLMQGIQSSRQPSR